MSHKSQESNSDCKIGFSRKELAINFARIPVFVAFVRPIIQINSSAKLSFCYCYCCRLLWAQTWSVINWPIQSWIHSWVSFECMSCERRKKSHRVYCLVMQHCILWPFYCPTVIMITRFHYWFGNQTTIISWLLLLDKKLHYYVL